MQAGEREAVQAIRSWIAAHGSPPSARAWDAAGSRPSYRYIAATIGWREAIAAAGAKPPAAGSRKTWTRETIVGALQAHHSRTGTWPRAIEWEAAAPGRPTTAVVTKAVGWNEALRIAGAAVPLPRRPPAATAKPPRRWTEAAIILAVVEWHSEHGRLPTLSDWARVTVPQWPSASTVTHRMRWPDARGAARLLIVLSAFAPSGDL